MSFNTRNVRIALSIPVAVAALAGAAYAHNYVGLEHPTLVKARVQSPNGLTADFPIPIFDTDLSVVCFKVRNTGAPDSRITGIGFELPDQSSSGFTLLTPLDSGFRLIEDVGHVPHLPDVTLDFALVTGHGFAVGRPRAGLAPSATLTTFCVSGPFPWDVAIERLLDRGVLRVQQVGPESELDDVAVWESRPQ